MSRVLLVNPPHSVRLGQPQGGKYGGMPVGLVYVGTGLRNAGHDVKVLDLHARTADFAAQKAISEDMETGQFQHHHLQTNIRDFDPDFCGIASMSPNHLAACDIAKVVKEVKDIPIIKGGPHETYCHELTLQNHPEIDISAVGHGVETAVELIRTLETGGDLGSVRGISYRFAGNIISTEPRPFPACLDAFPHPDRTLLEPSIFYDFGIFGGKRTAQVRMSHGCSYGCTFCATDSNYKFHNLEYMMVELQNVWNQGYSALFFDDAILSDNRWLLEEVMAMSSREGLKFEIGAQTRADRNTDRNMLQQLKNWGVSFLSIGLESGDEKILTSVNKKLNLNDVMAAVSRAKFCGIRTALTTIIGFPNETFDSVVKTVNVINQIRPDFVSFSVFSFYPGSKLKFDPRCYEDASQLATDPFLRANFDEGFGAKIAKPMAYINEAWDMINGLLKPEIRH